jgi:hypothetical protein
MTMNIEVINYAEYNKLTAEQKAALISAASEIAFPLTLDEYVNQAKRDEAEMIGNVSKSLECLAQSACEKIGIHPAGITFVIA